MKVRSWSLVLPLALALLAGVVPATSAQAPSTASPGTAAVNRDAPSLDLMPPLFTAADEVLVQILTGCTANLDCPDGTNISCTGQQSCLVGPNYVECDGDRWPYCPGTCGSGPSCVKDFQCLDYCGGGWARCSSGGCCIC